MQAVILAAGKSTRTYPLTITRPKPLLKVANKTLLEHNLDNLIGIVDEVIIIVGYKKGMIKKYFGNKYKNLKIEYVEQKQQLGTGHAVSLVESHIKDGFILLMGDDIYSKDDIKRCSNYSYAILTTKVNNPENFGVIVEKNGMLVDFVEKPKRFISNLANTALYVLNKKIFNYIKKIKKSERNEFELPDAIKLLSKESKINCVKTKNWEPIVYAWDLLKADRRLRGRRNIIGENSKISGNVVNSTIGNKCTVNGRVKNSLIMDNAIVEKGSVIEDTVIGANVSIKGTIYAKNNTFSIVKDKKVKIGRLGSIIGDNSNLTNVVVKAGCIISPNQTIKNKKIEHDV